MPIAHIINVGFAVRRQSSELIQMDKKFTWQFLVAFHISMTWHSVLSNIHVRSAHNYRNVYLHSAEPFGFESP